MHRGREPVRRLASAAEAAEQCLVRQSERETGLKIAIRKKASTLRNWVFVLDPI
jgi:hypothetical protein